MTLTVLVSEVSLLNCVIFSFWKFGIGINLFATLLESNANESGEYLLLIKELFLSHYLSILFIAALITGIILINRYLRKNKYALNNLSQLTIIVILLGCGVFLCRKISRQDDVRRNVLLSVRIGSDFKYALRAVKQYETFTNELNTLDSPETVKMNGDIKNIIFIIGECSNRMHYSLYDYYLQIGRAHV